MCLPYSVLYAVYCACCGVSQVCPNTCSLAFVAPSSFSFSFSFSSLSSKGTIHHWWRQTAAAFESGSKALDRREDEREAWRAIQQHLQSCAWNYVFSRHEGTPVKMVDFREEREKRAFTRMEVSEREERD